ncbi:MAG TPA: AAA family ATPase [Jatrophihabitantaceae bacterium]
MAGRSAPPGAQSAATELLERSEALATLAAQFDVVVAAGRGQLVLVRGEAGVGKTALVRRFCDEQGAAHVLLGGCDSLFTPRPLGAFLDIAHSVGGDLEQRAGSSASPYEFADALMRELQARPSSVVVVEDVHWADEATLDVLRIIARRVSGVPALFVVTYRDDEIDRHHPLRALLGELTFVERPTRIDVRPLSPSAVALLAAPHRVDADDLYVRTDGNPFFVTEALAAGGAEIPDTVRDAVLARTRRLSAQARQVLDAVAVIPQHAELWLLEAAAPESVDRLDECLAGGMLRAESGHVLFRHELARKAVEDSLPPTCRVALHRRVLSALSERPESADNYARLAHHAEAAGDARAVVRYARQAAERAAAVGAHRESADHYATVLRFSELLSLEERGELLQHQAHECYMTDRNAEALAALHQAIGCYQTLGDSRAEGNVLRTLSQYLWCPGRVAESWNAGRQSLALLERLDPDSRDVGHSYANLALLASYASDYDEAAALGARAAQFGERLGDVELLIAGLARLGERETLLGIDSGHEKFERAVALANEHRLVGAQGWLPLVRASVLLGRRDYDHANALLAHGLTYCSERGLELYRHYLLAYTARAEFEQGRWGNAADFAEQVLRVRRASTTPTIIALVVVGLLRARRGDPDVWSPLDQARELAEPTGELNRFGPVAAARAEAAWLEGRFDAAAAESQAAYLAAQKRQAPWLVGELALWRQRAGLDEGLPRDVAEPYARELAGDSNGAAECWTRIGCPYEAALALVDADEESLRRALTQLQALDARPAAAVVTRRLRERGVRGLPRGPRPATRDNPAGLTRRELDVLALLAQGLPNQQIAERLFLSSKTVDHHVSAILRKLGTRNRGEAGVEAVRLGLVPQHR